MIAPRQLVAPLGVVTLGSQPRSTDISDYCGFWANDMVVVSSTGYRYVGNFGFDLDERLDPAGSGACWRARRRRPTWS